HSRLNAPFQHLYHSALVCIARDDRFAVAPPFQQALRIRQNEAAHVGCFGMAAGALRLKYRSYLLSKAYLHSLVKSVIVLGGLGGVLGLGRNAKHKTHHQDTKNTKKTSQTKARTKGYIESSDPLTRPSATLSLRERGWGGGVRIAKAFNNHVNAT